MNRKVTACGFLYVAPPNLDFSMQSHSAKVSLKFGDSEGFEHLEEL